MSLVMIILISIVLFLYAFSRHLLLFKRSAGYDWGDSKGEMLRYALIGHAILSVSILFFIILSYNIFVENTNVMLSFSLLPLPMTSIILLLTAYFPPHDRIKTTDNPDKLVDDSANLLFPLAKKSIKILSGTLNPKLYRNSKVIDGLKSANDRGVKIEILFAYPKDKEPRKEVENLINQELAFLRDSGSLFVLPEADTGNHFIVIDRSHFRVEKVHGVGNSGSTNFIHFFSYISALLLRSEHRKLRLIARQVGQGK